MFIVNIFIIYIKKYIKIKKWKIDVILGMCITGRLMEEDAAKLQPLFL